jgi:hypothetical protein
MSSSFLSDYSEIMCNKVPSPDISSSENRWESVEHTENYYSKDENKNSHEDRDNDKDNDCQSKASSWKMWSVTRRSETSAIE